MSHSSVVLVVSNRNRSSWCLALAVALAVMGCGEHRDEHASDAGDAGVPFEVGSVSQGLASSGVSSAGVITLNIGSQWDLPEGVDFVRDTTLVRDPADASMANRNRGGRTTLAVGTNTSNLEYRGLLWFDLAQLPSAVNGTSRISVTSVKLGVEPVTPPTATQSLYITKAVSPWLEGTHNNVACTLGATWNKPNCAASATWTGGTAASPPAADNLGTFTFTTSTSPRVFSLPASIVSDFQSAGVFNGWVLRRTSSGSLLTATVSTREGDVSPELEIQYTCKPDYPNDVDYGPGGCTGSVGAACTDNGHCASAVCNAGTCMGAPGDVCTNGTQCITGICSRANRCMGLTYSLETHVDTFIESARPSGNHGNAPAMVTGRTQVGAATNDIVSIMDFRSGTAGPWIPPNAVIDLVQLRATQFAATGDALVPVQLRRVVSSSSTVITEGVGGSRDHGCSLQGGATWNHADCASPAKAWVVPPTNSSLVATSSLDRSGGRKTWTLDASEVISMASSTTPRLYTFVTPDTASVGTTRTFQTTQSNFGGEKPTVVVTYHCKPGYTQSTWGCYLPIGSVCTSSYDCASANCLCNAGDPSCTNKVCQP